MFICYTDSCSGIVVLVISYCIHIIWHNCCTLGLGNLSVVYCRGKVDKTKTSLSTASSTLWATDLLPAKHGQLLLRGLATGGELTFMTGILVDSR